MTYPIPEDTLPGAQPGRIAPYFTILITGILAGPWIGFGWAVFNGYALGCRDMPRQWLVLGLAAAAVTAAAVTGRWLRLVHEPDEIGHLTGQITTSASIMILVLAFTFVGMRQAVLYRLHMRGRRSLWGIPAAVALIVVSFVLRGMLPSDPPLWRHAIGGMFLG